MKIASWLRQMVRQIALTEVPASWQEAQAAERSHDSRDDDTRGMLRLDQPSRAQWQHRVGHWAVSKAQVIRQLSIQATPEDFPTSWHRRAAKRRAQPARHSGTKTSRQPTA